MEYIPQAVQDWGKLLATWTRVELCSVARAAWPELDETYGPICQLHRKLSDNTHVQVPSRHI